MTAARATCNTQQFWLHPGDNDASNGGDEYDDEDAPEEVQRFDAYKIVCHENNMFEAVRKVHREACHLKTRGLERKVKLKYARIPRWVCGFVCDSCGVYNNRVAKKIVRAGHTPILVAGFGTRGVRST